MKSDSRADNRPVQKLSITVVHYNCIGSLVGYLLAVLRAHWRAGPSVTVQVDRIRPTKFTPAASLDASLNIQY